jgi:Uma2 family endonuclease
MITATAPTSAPPERVVLRGVSWETYEALLRDLDGQHLRLTYDRGTLEIMSPSRHHARAQKFIARLIESFTLEFNIPLVGLSDTTWKSESLAKGLEADECYYVGDNALWVAALDEDAEIHLPGDPPPDLAIEVDITSSSLDKEAIYASLGVPELWRWEADELRVRVLRPDGKYERRNATISFPQLPIAVIEQVVRRRTSIHDTAVMREFSAWVRSQFPNTNP